MPFTLHIDIVSAEAFIFSGRATIVNARMAVGKLRIHRDAHRASRQN